MGNQQASGEKSNAGEKGGGAQEGPGEPVFLNVYKSRDGGPSLPGFGVYHSGLMVYGTEYTFAGSIVAGTGVQSQRPEWQPDNSPWVFDRSVPLGKTSLSKRDVQALVDVLKREFPATSYNLTTRNCNHFTETMTLRLGLKYPSWVNRASNTISSIPLVNKMAADRSAPKAADGLAPPDSQTQEQIRAQLDKPLTEQKDLCVNDRIDVSRAGVLNAAKPSSVQQCLRPASVDSKAAARLQRGVFSDADEQMIIILPMKTPQRITALEFTVDAANPGTCPKRIKVYRNMPNVDFSSVEDAKPTHELTISTPPIAPSPANSLVVMAFDLPVARFRDTGCITLFVESNHGATSTAVRELALIARIDAK